MPFFDQSVTRQVCFKLSKMQPPSQIFSMITLLDFLNECVQMIIPVEGCAQIQKFMER